MTSDDLRRKEGFGPTSPRQEQFIRLPSRPGRLRRLVVYVCSKIGSSARWKRSELNK